MCHADASMIVSRHRENAFGIKQAELYAQFTVPKGGLAGRASVGVGVVAHDAQHLFGYLQFSLGQAGSPDEFRSRASHYIVELLPHSPAFVGHNKARGPKMVRIGCI